MPDLPKYPEPASEADAIERQRRLQLKLEAKDGASREQKHAILDEKRYLKAWIVRHHADDFHKNRVLQAELEAQRAENARQAAELEVLRQEVARLQAELDRLRR